MPSCRNLSFDYAWNLGENWNKTPVVLSTPGKTSVSAELPNFWSEFSLTAENCEHDVKNSEHKAKRHRTNVCCGKPGTSSNYSWKI